MVLRKVLILLALINLLKLASEFNGAARLAKFWGLSDNQARLSANQAIHRTYGINCMETLQIIQLDQEEQEIRLAVSGLGMSFV